MRGKTLRAWRWVHTWSSLVCTAFMLLLCVTGLPLIFHHEIGHWLGTEVETPVMPADAPRASLDQVLDAARALHPDRVVQYASHPEDSDALWFITLTPTPDADDDFRSVVVDARTAKVLAQPLLDEGFLWLVGRLHVDLFAGSPGTLLLGLMGLLLLAAIVSGAVLYAPFMRKLDFGTVRRDRRTRLAWLDLHNLLGIVTMVWLFVVGATGTVNTLSDWMVDHWRDERLAAVPTSHGTPMPVTHAAMQRSLEAALAQAPQSTLSFIAFPGSAYSSPHHHTFYLKGNTPLTARLLQPVLVDAGHAEVSASPELPWYLTAMLLSQPLHFGDYGGRAMQMLWALLDLAAIVVLVSGLRLWWRKGVATPQNDAPAHPARQDHAPRSAPRKSPLRWPLALGLLTAIGLVSALFSEDGLGDMLAGACLAAPVAAGLWFGYLRRSRSQV